MSSMPSRRDLLASLPWATGAAMAITLASACTSPRIAEPPMGVMPPRIPEDSPDFDVLNSLLQLEFREVALISEIAVGERLDPTEADLAEKMRRHHLAHADVLARLIESVGGKAGEVRERYVLPTPLGDQRRALETLLVSESHLVEMYKFAIGNLTALKLSPSVASNLFVDAMHVAALKTLLELSPSIVALA